MSYHIVEFTKEKSAHVVHSSWIFRDPEDGEKLLCYWPPVDTKAELMRALKDNSDADMDWQTHSIRKLGTAKTIPEAVSKLRDAVYTSNVDTKDDDDRGVSRRRKKRTASYHEVGDVYREGAFSDGDLPAPPPEPVFQFNSQAAAKTVTKQQKDTFRQNPVHVQQAGRSETRVCSKRPSMNSCSVSRRFDVTSCQVDNVDGTEDSHANDLD